MNYHLNLKILKRSLSKDHHTKFVTKLFWFFVGEFDKNVSQSKITKTLGYSASKVHDIANTFRECGVMHKGKAWNKHWVLVTFKPSGWTAEKPSCNSDLYIFMDSAVLHTTQWMVFRCKRWLLNRVCHCIQRRKLKLCYWSKKLYIYSEEVLLTSPGTRSSEIDRKTVNKCSVVKWDCVSTCFWNLLFF